MLVYLSHRPWESVRPEGSCNNYEHFRRSVNEFVVLTSQLRIMVQNVLGSRQSADMTYNNYQDYDLPEMKALSDMMWAMWEYCVP